jgi:hypothetical protein
MIRMPTQHLSFDAYFNQGFPDIVHDSFGPSGSRFDITGSNPTFDPSGLEMGTNRVRGLPIFTRMADEDHRRQCFLRGIRILLDLVTDSLHKIARGRGSSKGADDGHFADHQCPNLTRSLR